MSGSQLTVHGSLNQDHEPGPALLVRLRRRGNGRNSIADWRWRGYDRLLFMPNGPRLVFVLSYDAASPWAGVGHVFDPCRAYYHAQDAVKLARSLGAFVHAVPLTDFLDVADAMGLDALLHFTSGQAYRVLDVIALPVEHAQPCYQHPDWDQSTMEPPW